MDRLCRRTNLRFLGFRGLVVIRLIDRLICAADPCLEMATGDQHDEWICGGDRGIGFQVTPTLIDLETISIDDHNEQRLCLSTMPPPTSLEFLRELSNHPPHVSAIL